MTTTIETKAPEPVAGTRLAAYGILAAVVATLVNVLVRVVAVAFLGVPTGFGPLGWGPIINTTVVGIVGAACVYGLLTRVSKRPNRAFRRIALIALLLSFVPLVTPPAFLVGAPVAVLGTLAAMHVTTAAVAVGLLPRANAEVSAA